MSDEPNIAVSVNIPLSRVADLLCCALEGGSNYWCMIEKHIKPKRLDFRSDGKRVFKHLDYPLNTGGALIIGDAEEADKGKHRLNLRAISKGLKLMAEKHPQHWGDFLAENEDAETGDVFLQLCLFGEVIYG